MATEQIAVLGWGSLIWQPKNLNINSLWKKDGPFLPIEYARISKDRRLTLVIKPNAKSVPVFWNYMFSNSLDDAIENLKEREQMINKNRVGFIDFKDNKHSNSYPEVIEEIKKWGKSKNLDAVVWTDLGINFKDKSRMCLTIDNILTYLDGLEGPEKLQALTYINNTPKQIKTEYRDKIEKKFINL